MNPDLSKRVALLERVGKYITERRKMVGLDAGIIHALHTGHETRACEITLTDLSELHSALVAAEKDSERLMYVCRRIRGSQLRRAGIIVNDGSSLNSWREAIDCAIPPIKEKHRE